MIWFKAAWSDIFGYNSFQYFIEETNLLSKLHSFTYLRLQNFDLVSKIEKSKV